MPFSREGENLKIYFRKFGLTEDRVQGNFPKENCKIVNRKFKNSVNVEPVYKGIFSKKSMTVNRPIKILPIIRCYLPKGE